MTALATTKAGEVRKAAKDVRRQLAATLMWLDARDFDRAYAAAEATQMAAFEMKSLVSNGGDYINPELELEGRIR